MRWAPLAALLAALVAGCGGSGSSTEVLQPTSAALSGFYISITAPSEITQFLANWALQGSSGVLVVAKPQGPKVCSYTGKITDAEIHYKVPAVEASRLSKYVGHSWTVAIYGTNPYVAAACKGLQTGMSSS